jgi:NAD(P)-dependent dehydrogenase (short-subunit alcohol dehydrogenase family)
MAQQLNAQGFSAQAYEVDVTNEHSIEAAMQAVVDRSGRIDCLFNNAGLAIRKPSLELSVEDWQKVLDVNLTGALSCATGSTLHGQAPKWLHHQYSVHHGTVWRWAIPQISHQSTKGAVVNLTRSLAVEWAREGIRVNAIAPTWVHTDFIKPLGRNPELLNKLHAMTPMGRIAEVDEIVERDLPCQPSPAGMATGHTLAIDWWFFSAVKPRLEYSICIAFALQLAA